MKPKIHDSSDNILMLGGWAFYPRCWRQRAPNCALHGGGRWVRGRCPLWEKDSALFKNEAAVASTGPQAEHQWCKKCGQRLSISSPWCSLALVSTYIFLEAWITARQTGLHDAGRQLHTPSPQCTGGATQYIHGWCHAQRKLTRSVPWAIHTFQDWDYVWADNKLGKTDQI